MGNRFFDTAQPKNRMYPYEHSMKEYNLSQEDIITFFCAVDDNDMQTIEHFFSSHEEHQVEGLLKMFVDLNDLKGDGKNFHFFMGTALQIAEKRGHTDLHQRLLEQLETLQHKNSPVPK